MKFKIDLFTNYLMIMPMGAGATISEGKKMRALTATKARVNINTAIKGAIY
jgi:hypothetical protein